MKKLFVIFIATFCCFNSYASDPDQEKTSIPIKEIRSEAEVGRERSLLLPVYALLNHSSGIIELELNGVGSGEVIIIDDGNNVVSSLYVSSSDELIYLPSPAVDGVFMLGIYCEHYCGEGMFTI